MYNTYSQIDGACTHHSPYPGLLHVSVCAVCLRFPFSTLLDLGSLRSESQRRIRRIPGPLRRNLEVDSFVRFGDNRFGLIQEHVGLTFVAATRSCHIGLHAEVEVFGERLPRNVEAHAGEVGKRVSWPRFFLTLILTSG